MRTIALLSILLLTGVSTDVEAQLLPTKLRVTVIDGLGNFVEGATVALYENEKDYLASENPIALLKTDKKGRVMFKELKTISYFIEAKNGEQTNDGEGVQTAVLSEGKVNRVNTIIE